MSSFGPTMTFADADFRSQFAPGNYIVEDFSGSNTNEGAGELSAYPGLPPPTQLAPQPPMGNGLPGLAGDPTLLGEATTALGATPQAAAPPAAGTPTPPPNPGGAGARLDPSTMDDASLMQIVMGGPPGQTSGGGGGAPPPGGTMGSMESPEAAAMRNPSEVARMLLQKRAEDRRAVSESFQKKAREMNMGGTPNVGY